MPNESYISKNMTNESIRKFSNAWFLRVAIGVTFYSLEPPVSILVGNPQVNFKSLRNVYKGFFSKGLFYGIKQSNSGLMSFSMHIGSRESIRIGLAQTNNRIFGTETDDNLKNAAKIAILAAGDTIVHPFDTVRTRMAKGMHKKANFKEIIQQQKLYNGVLGTLSKSVLFWSSLLITDQTIKNTVKDFNNLKENEDLNINQKLQVSLAKGVFASLAIFPSEIVTSSLQAADKNFLFKEKAKLVMKNMKNYKLLSRLFCFKGTSNLVLCATWNTIMNILAEKDNEKTI